MSTIVPRSRSRSAGVARWTEPARPRSVRENAASNGDDAAKPSTCGPMHSSAPACENGLSGYSRRQPLSPSSVCIEDNAPRSVRSS
ncbi:hypothetical protein DO72_5050 [Burkholderia pseudomallei]|nr:hypothetical protein DO72_5050 [Burkholderia pseudomallei]